MNQLKRLAILTACAALIITGIITRVVVSGEAAPQASTTVSFTGSAFNVAEDGGYAPITLTRTGDATGKVSVKVNATNVTASNADWGSDPAAVDPSFQVGVGANDFV